MKTKALFRLILRWMGITFILLIGTLSNIGCRGSSDTEAAPIQQDGHSNWNEMVWDKDKWS